MSHRSLSAFAFVLAAAVAAAVLAAAFLVPGLLAGSSPSEASPQQEKVVKAKAPQVKTVQNRPAPGQRIVGNVGPGFTISVAPRRVQPGTYRFVIHDNSTMHNWHITGPGVNKRTPVAFQGTRRFTLELTTGRYRIQCDVHPLEMNTRLRVGVAG